MTSKTILSISRIKKYFGGIAAVRDISFDLGEGEVLGLIGPNGSGKTTMMNLISGALKPTAGTISLYDRKISGQPPHRLAQFGIARTFQLVRILPSLSVLDNVSAGGVFGHKRLWGKGLKKHARHLLDKVGIKPTTDAPVSDLTYIDQKRIELARALASDPKVLLLDEWLAGLNPTELKTGIALVESLKAEGMTIIIVEHVMAAIRSLCDRCVVMSSGAMIAEGAPAKVLSDPTVIEAYLGEVDA